MSPCVYHLGSFSQILSLPVPDGVVTQTAIFAKDRVSSRILASVQGSKVVSGNKTSRGGQWSGNETSRGGQWSGNETNREGGQ